MAATAGNRVSRKIMGRLRLASQGLLGPGLGSVPDAVRWMTATQAQDLQAALWAVGLRVPGAAVSDVRAAIDGGTVVRSWPMRGTLHLVAPEDLRWMLGLTAERLTRMPGNRTAYPPPRAKPKEGSSRPRSDLPSPGYAETAATPMATPTRTETVPPTIHPFVSRASNCHKLPKVMVLP